MRRAIRAGLGTIVCAALAWSQQAAPDSRAAQIEAQRRAKARALAPDLPPHFDRILETVRHSKIVEHIIGDSDGWRPQWGGLVTYSGFAIGPAYQRHFDHDRVVWHIGGSASLRDYYQVSTGVSLPRLLHDFAFLDISAAHRDFPNVDYYGPGPDSRKSGRAGYRLTDSSVSARGGIRPAAHLSIGALGRFLAVDIGPTGDSRYAPVMQVFPNAPGLFQPSNFLQSGGYLNYDHRDNPGGPHRGGDYTAELSHYGDLLSGRYSFQRTDLDAQQYIPFWNDRRVIALHAHAAFSDPQGGNQVPFYLQPQLGGPDSLRGFRPFRFYDRDAFYLNGEYRWEVFSGLDMALFVDAGQVFHKLSDFRFTKLETSYGAGFRFNARDNVFLRIDIGFSREGVYAWLNFDNIF